MNLESSLLRREAPVLVQLCPTFYCSRVVLAQIGNCVVVCTGSSRVLTVALLRSLALKYAQVVRI